MAAIEIKNLQKSYREKMVIEGLSLDIESGEFLVVLGPNGAGKTTLIRILSTLLRPTSGEISINGYDLRDEAIEVRSSIGVLPHSPFLYDHLTLNENFIFFLKMFGLKKDNERIKNLVTELKLLKLLNCKVGTFSQGIKQKAALGTIILLDSDVLLLDEPETGLDPYGQKVLLDLLKKLHQQEKTILLTSNNVEFGYKAADRFIILISGSIAYECKKKDISMDALNEEYQSLMGGIK